MDSYAAGPFLSQIEIPSDLRAKFKPEELQQVADELRQFIVDVVSEKGGHFGASLGVVELTVALHYVFNTPEDQIVWDVGHQAYGHKILTGRRGQFHTNRQYKGVSGFPKRSESEYDTFGVGHSSTSVSAALGMAVGSRHNGDTRRQHVAVIGDGAMTAGLAFEGLNHAGVEDTNMLVILNDNCMSIDPNVGALKEYLTDITTSHTYNRVKDEVWELLGRISKFGPNAQAIAHKVEHAVKGALLKQSNLFESLNFRYFGPVDGHDVEHMTRVLADLKDIPGPKLLHVVTRKGAGYAPAEAGSPTQWHAPGLFNKETGEILKGGNTGPKPPKFQDVFGHTMIELAKKDRRIVGVTPAMPSGCSLKFMMEEMPDRAFDVGIAEQHAVTFSAGASCSVPTTKSSTMSRSKNCMLCFAWIAEGWSEPMVPHTTGCTIWPTCDAFRVLWSAHPWMSRNCETSCTPPLRIMRDLLSFAILAATGRWSNGGRPLKASKLVAADACGRERMSLC
jgi:1-deoxy-D-xylulose-5-phosphate synthase